MADAAPHLKRPGSGSGYPIPVAGPADCAPVT